MVIYDFPRDRPWLYQIYLAFSIWIWPLFQSISMYVLPPDAIPTCPLFKLQVESGAFVAFMNKTTRTKCTLVDQRTSSPPSSAFLANLPPS